MIKNSKMDFYSVASSRPFTHSQISWKYWCEYAPSPATVLHIKYPSQSPYDPNSVANIKVKRTCSAIIIYNFIVTQTFLVFFATFYVFHVFHNLVVFAFSFVVRTSASFGRCRCSLVQCSFTLLLLLQVFFLLFFQPLSKFLLLIFR